MPGQAGLHADSKAYASLMRVARPWAAAPKMSAPQRLSTAGEAAPREPPRQGVTYCTEPGFTIPIYNTINKYKYVLYTILAQGPRIIPPCHRPAALGREAGVWSSRDTCVPAVAVWDGVLRALGWYPLPTRRLESGGDGSRWLEMARDGSRRCLSQAIHRQSCQEQ